MPTPSDRLTTRSTDPSASSFRQGSDRSSAGDPELGRDLSHGESVTTLSVDLVIHLTGEFGLSGSEFGFGSADASAGSGGRETIHRPFLT